MRRTHEPEFVYRPTRPPRTPTSSAPGSEERILTYIARAELGVEIFGAEDSRLFADVVRPTGRPGKAPPIDYPDDDDDDDD